MIDLSRSEEESSTIDRTGTHKLVLARLLMCRELER